ncbi:hypothetical protein R3P38DRAFT_2821810 [Favolaschia claudopus]|uniref:Uncharacterized protein n=1 Tax=Favolaschia claudopus TaxID=2862362 RepID=A0AAW0EEM8_9AGAR
MQHIPCPFPSSSSPPMSSSQRSLFVTLAAQAISSVGFSVSILAWIWLTLVPRPKPELTEPIAIDKKARRRSAPAALPSAKRRSTTTSLASTEAQSSPVSQRTRKVYFADSPAPAPSRPTNLPRTSTDSSDLSLIASPSEFSPCTLETWRESAVESDSSTSSPRPSLSLSRPFQKACRPRRSSTTSATSEITPNPLPDHVSSAENKQQSRRASGGIIPPWSFRRVSGSKNVPSPVTAAPTPSSTSATPSAQIFAAKTRAGCQLPSHARSRMLFRIYAQPPTDDETYIAYLRTCLSLARNLSPAVPTSDMEPKTKRRRRRCPERGRNRKANDQAQAALGHGRRPTPKRSASEGWTAAKDPRP